MDWYVYQHDGRHLGPWPPQVIARAIAAGRLAKDVWVGTPGGQGWLPVTDVPEIAGLIRPVAVASERPTTRTPATVFSTRGQRTRLLAGEGLRNSSAGVMSQRGALASALAASGPRTTLVVGERRARRRSI